MKIKKMYQGTAPENKILNIKSDSQTDVYSCDYINKLNTYSTEEQVIGTWIDGKPIYRKVIELGQMPNNTSKKVETGLNHTDIRITDLYGVVHTNTGSYQAKLNDSVSRLNLLPSNEINITVLDDFRDFYGYAILEYIKTTD